MRKVVIIPSKTYIRTPKMYEILPLYVHSNYTVICYYCAATTYQSSSLGKYFSRDNYPKVRISLRGNCHMWGSFWGKILFFSFGSSIFGPVSLDIYTGCTIIMATLFSIQNCTYLRTGFAMSFKVIIFLHR